MQLFLGPNVQALEQEFAQFCGVKHAIGCGSGTDACLLSLQAAGIGPGDEVITVSWTFIATIASLVHLGAKPVLVDIEPTHLTWTRRRWSRDHAAHQGDHAHPHLRLPADMGALQEIADEHGLLIIETPARRMARATADRGSGAWAPPPRSASI